MTQQNQAAETWPYKESKEFLAGEM